jgi:hypothetical protein
MLDEIWLGYWTEIPIGNLSTGIRKLKEVLSPEPTGYMSGTNIAHLRRISNEERD